jgi:hypothetical protein
MSRDVESARREVRMASEPDSTGKFSNQKSIPSPLMTNGPRGRTGSKQPNSPGPDFVPQGNYSILG